MKAKATSECMSIRYTNTKNSFDSGAKEMVRERFSQVDSDLQAIATSADQLFTYVNFNSENPHCI